MSDGHTVRRAVEFALRNGDGQWAKEILHDAAKMSSASCRVWFALEFLNAGHLKEFVRLVSRHKCWDAFVRLFFFSLQGACDLVRRAADRMHYRIAAELAHCPEAPPLMVETLYLGASWVYLAFSCWEDSTKLLDAMTARSIQVLTAHISLKAGSGFFAVRIFEVLKAKQSKWWPTALRMLERALCDEGVSSNTIAEVVRANLFAGMRMDSLNPRTVFALRSVPDKVQDEIRA